MSLSIPSPPVSGGLTTNSVQTPGTAGTPQTSSARESDFKTTLENCISQVESLHSDAEKRVEGLLSGQGNDVHSAIIAVEKADLSFQLMMQVRNKIVQAYEQISQMPF